MWQFSSIDNPTRAQLWFSDSEPISTTRGGWAVSNRLIIDKQGLVDITDLQSENLSSIPPSSLDLNGSSMYYSGSTVVLNLSLPGDGSFRFAVGKEAWTSGQLKPLPNISDTDAKFMDEMIAGKYVPYQCISDAPGKPVEEIEALGRQFFPFSPHSFQLAMAVYDWTSASFARMVLMKIFAYTGIHSTPHPLDSKSIADAIWESNWPPYVPSDKYYMNSFMMQPASSLSEVQSQLANLEPTLQQFAEVENRMLSAAFTSLPRTSVLHAPQIFSGQVDISQLTLDHFGIEFLECPLNVGPPGIDLEMAFTTATASFIKPNSVITTKMVWSFADSLDIAKHYQNGLVLIANPPDNNSRVWDEASYITPLSNDPEKNEYTFAPGTSFVIQSLEQGEVDGKPVQFLTLKLHSPGRAFRDETGVVPRPPLSDVPMRRVNYPSHNHYLAHNTGGRRCHCVEQGEKSVA